MVERRLLIIGITIIVFTKIIIVYLPLNIYKKLLFETPKKITCSEFDKNSISSLIKSIKRIKKFVPWKDNCLNMVISAKMLCNLMNINSEVYIGITKYSTGIKKAHISLLIDNKYHFLGLKDSKLNNLSLFK